MADKITSEVLREVGRAMRKFPTWPTDPLHALAVLGEEFGELTKDVLQLTYEPHKTNRDNVRTEAIQTAAMALRFAASLDTYEYSPGVQHAQTAIGASTEESPAEAALRSLACWLGVGGYNAPEVDAEVFEQKIRDGVDMLLAGRNAGVKEERNG